MEASLANSSSAPNAIPRSRSVQAALAACILLIGSFATCRLYFPSATAHPTDDAPPRRQIELNRADRQELLQIPGLGPNSADAILAHRAERGPFGSLDELTHVHGIGPKTTEKVKPWLQLGATADEPVERLERKHAPASSPVLAGKGNKLLAADPKIDVNAAGEADLMRLPGIGSMLAARIVQQRSTAAFASIDDLRRVKGIGAKTMDAIRPFVVVKK